MQLKRLVIAASAALATSVLTASATAAPAARCSSPSATVVAVDFAHWGGPVVRGCLTGRRSADDLLHAAGFTTAGDDHDGPAFICRLGDGAFHHGAQYPTPSEESCVLTPPASAYWSSWLAPAGSHHWEYSQLGAMSEAPARGEVELWTFGATDIAGTHGSGVPRFSPALLRASSHARSLGEGGPAIVDALATSGRTSSGSPVGLIAGIAIALVLAGGAVWTVRRRGRDG